jgi:hypothetical protein
VDGIELVMQLMHFPTSRTVIMIGQENIEGAQHFTKIHGLAKASVVGIAPEDREEDPALAQWYVIERQRSAGPINLVLTAYPEVYRRCAATHQAVILFARRGSLGAPEMRPTWGELHNRVIRRRDAEAEAKYPEDTDLPPAVTSGEWHMSPHGDPR